MDFLPKTDNQTGVGGPGPSAAQPGPVPPPSPKDDPESSGFMGGLRVSLMPSAEGEEPGTNLRRQLVVFFVVLIVETLIIGGAFLFVTKKEADATAIRQGLEQELAGVTRQIQESEAGTKVMTLFDARVRVATDLLDNHAYWTSLFDYIRSKTKPSVIFMNFSGDRSSGMVTLDAMGASYRDVAEQIVILREDPMVKEVISSSASATVSETGEVLGVSFGLVLKLKPDVWKLAAAQAGTVEETPGVGMIEEIRTDVGTVTGNGQ